MSNSKFLKYLKSYQPKDFLIKEGDKEQDFFCLLEGTVAVWKGDFEDKTKIVKIGTIDKKGEYFGEMGWLLKEPRTASITAEGPVKVLKFPGDMLTELLAAQPKLGIKLCTALADRLKGTTTKSEKVAQERNVIREDATAELLHAKYVFQKMFMMLTAIQKQFQNPLLKTAIEYMGRDRLLQGGQKLDVDEEFLRDVPPRISDLLQRTYST